MSKTRDELIDAYRAVTEAWREYTGKHRDIIAHSDMTSALLYLGRAMGPIIGQEYKRRELEEIEAVTTDD